jgi:hypothetical protein
MKNLTVILCALAASCCFECKFYDPDLVQPRASGEGLSGAAGVWVPPTGGSVSQDPGVWERSEDPSCLDPFDGRCIKWETRRADADTCPDPWLGTCNGPAAGSSGSGMLRPAGSPAPAPVAGSVGSGGSPAPEPEPAPTKCDARECYSVEVASNSCTYTALPPDAVCQDHEGTCDGKGSCTLCVEDDNPCTGTTWKAPRCLHPFLTGNPCPGGFCDDTGSCIQDPWK